MKQKILFRKCISVSSAANIPAFRLVFRIYTKWRLTLWWIALAAAGAACSAMARIFKRAPPWLRRKRSHPDDVIDSRRRLSRLVDAVRELPPQCGKVFRLHKLEGRTHAEVAAELGISKSAVEKHMIAALKHLSRRLQ